MVLNLKLRLRPGVDDDLIAFFGQVPPRHCAGAVKESMRETDDAVVRRARIFADTMDGCWGEAGDILRVSRRDTVVLPSMGNQGPLLKAATIEAARTMMPGWDIYALEADWRDLWFRSGRPSLRSPDAAFIGWLKKRG